jgi:hypothetical protein
MHTAVKPYPSCRYGHAVIDAAIALHNELDEWVPVAGQREFVETLRSRAPHPGAVQLHAYGASGAPHEHAGFGRFAADAKDRGTAFLAATLLSQT